MAMAVKKTDIHTHILPGIDDGAKNISESLALLKEQKSQGVNQVIFTPHFRFKNNGNASKDIKEFIEKRDMSFKLLTENSSFKDFDISVKMGSEVYYSVDLSECIYFDELCISGTSYLLIELPMQIKPHGMKYVMSNLINKGYIPVIAHIERYSYIMDDPMLLYDLVEIGCLSQINAEVFIEKNKRVNILKKMIKLGLVHFISSDCHSIEKRPPNLKQGYSEIQKKVGVKYLEMFDENSKLLFDNKIVESQNIREPINILGVWV